MRDQLSRDGWILVRGGGPAAFESLPGMLDGAVIHRTDVAIRPGRALITSDRELELHTDHHRADWIAWHCIRQTTEGGETRLADAEVAFASLTLAERALLMNLRLFEHSVFAGDASTHPVVELVGPRLRFYCSFWFEGELDQATNAALDAFRSACRSATVANLRLLPGDVLVVDNRRILHGRSAITGSRDRHLIRHWLARRTAPVAFPEVT